MTLSFLELVRVFPVAGKSGLYLSFKHVGFIVSYYVKVEKHYVNIILSKPNNVYFNQT